MGWTTRWTMGWTKWSAVAISLALVGCNAIIDYGALEGGGADAGPSADAGPPPDGGSDAGEPPIDAALDASADDAGPGDGGASDGGVDGGCGPLDTETSCGACGVTCAAGSACLPADATHRCVPADCAAVAAQRVADGLALDDDVYTIDVDGAGSAPAFDVWCADLATEPAEYLEVDPTSNYSSSKDDVSCDCDIERRYWSRLRLLIGPGPTFGVDVRDIRFTTVRGFLADGTEDPSCVTERAPPCRNVWDPGRNPFGNAWLGTYSCAWEPPQADGVYDLSGTPFRFPFIVHGTYQTVGTHWGVMVQSASVDTERRRITTSYSAACGSWGPSPLLPFAMTTIPDTIEAPLELAP